MAKKKLQRMISILTLFCMSFGMLNITGFAETDHSHNEISCEACTGLGTVQCSVCGGTGTVSDDTEDGTAEEITCSACGGEGYATCEACNGADATAVLK